MSGYMDIDIKELKKLKASLVKAKSRIREEAARVLDLNTNRMVGDIKMNTPVDTGLLRNSFERSLVKEEKEKLETEVATNIEYAPYVEYGHRKADGSGFVPGWFMVTAAEKRAQEKLDQDVSRLEKELRKAMR